MMNKTVAVHGSWLIVAACALTIGIWLGGRGDSDELTAPRQPDAKKVATMTTSDMKNRSAGLDRYFLEEMDLPAWLRHDRPLVESEIRVAIDETVSQSNPLRRSWLFQQLVANLSEDNVEKTWDMLVSETTHNSEDQHHMALLAYRWGELDGERAMQMVEESGRADGVLLGTAAMEAWARQDGASAQSWIDREERDVTAPIKSAFLAGLSTKDLQAASNYLIALQSESNATSHIRAVLDAQIKQRGLAGAEQWMQGLPDEQLKANTLNQLARKKIKEDLKGTASWVLSYAELDYGGDAVASVAEEWVKQTVLDSPEVVNEAMNWIESLPDGPVKEAALGRALRTWAHHQPNEAGAYLGQLPESGAKDQAIKAFSLQVMRADPEAAVRWASTISNPETQEKAMVTAARVWYRMDQTAAKAWLSESSLPSTAIQKITGVKPAAN